MFSDGDVEMLRLVGATDDLESRLLESGLKIRQHKDAVLMDSTELIDFANKLLAVTDILDLKPETTEEVKKAKCFVKDLKAIVNPKG